MNVERGNTMSDNISILVVDDEDRIRRLLKMYLEREGYEIDEAENGEEALAMTLEKDYHCILLDIMMPEKDGLQVCEELRERSTTPIILLTACSALYSLISTLIK